MGSLVELNDTLQISREQGFPAVLDFETHKSSPYSASDFKDKIFAFQGKKDIRNYQQPPVRCFLVENANGEWLYWGQAFIQSITHDYNEKTTSGTYKIVRIYTPDEMVRAKDLIEFRKEQ